jgi:hypothetical protein
MTLEDQLRAVFAARVEASRSLDDPAGQAIRRARTARRRRNLGSGLALVIVAVLGLSGAAWFQARLTPATGNGVAGGPMTLPRDEATSAEAPPAPPPATDAPERSATVAPPPGGTARDIGLDLQVGLQLWTVAGERYPLTGVAEVTRIFRVPLGWVYSDAQQQRLLRLDGRSIELGNFGTRWMVSPDGARLAAVRDRRLSVYRIGVQGLATESEVPAPADGRPVAFVGEQVLVSSGKRYAAFPPVGSDGPVWTQGLVSVYGATSDSVAGLVADPDRDEVCLASLEPADDGLVVISTGSCRADPPATEAKPLLAPGGGWLAEPDEDGTRLVDFRSALDDARRPVACPVPAEVPPVWVDGTTLVVADGRQAVRCRIDGYTEYIDLPTDLAADWSFVPRLMPTEAD